MLNGTIRTLAGWVMAVMVGAASAGVPEILPDPDGKPGSNKKPVKVYFLSGQSNMVGMGQQGSLKPLVEQDEKFGYLVDEDGNWTVRKDVHYINYVMDNRKNDEPLTVYGRFGPEVGIGHVMGTYHDETVLLIKGSCGNRSLGWDFCPPSAVKRQGREQEVENAKAAGKWYAGKSYDRYVGHAKAVLANLDGNLPGYEGQGYELAGIFWWQGHKDKGMAKEEYLQLLGELIEDFRKDFNAPNAKFVVATVGFNGHNLGAWKGVWEAQMAISQQPKFKGNVASVDIRDIGGGGFHYGNNGATYAKVGDRMGRAMVGLLDQGGGNKASTSTGGGAARPETPMPEGLDPEAVSVKLRPAVVMLSKRQYPAALRQLELVEKANERLDDAETTKADAKDIKTIRTFIDEQTADMLKRIDAYTEADNPYQAFELMKEANRSFRGIDAYDERSSELMKTFREPAQSKAIREGGRFYQLLANAQRARNDRAIELLADFAEKTGNTPYGKAAKAAVAALKENPEASLDGDALVAGQ
jgi:tetratricopeptide (TPR) repeat protein